MQVIVKYMTDTNLIKNDILYTKLKLRNLESQVSETRRDLELLLAKCPHEWKDSPRGYEHEGKFCKFCGISDLAIKR